MFNTRFPFRPTTALLWCCLAAIAMALAPGCAGLTEEDVRDFRAQAADARDAIAAERAHLESLRSAFPEGTRERAELDASIAGADAKAAALTAGIARLDAALAEADNPSDALTIGADAASAFLPAPARLPVVLGAALLATLMRARQLKKGAASIADSLSKAMKTDPEMRAALARHADTLRTIQTPTARRIVDEQTKLSPMVRLPI